MENQYHHIPLPSPQHFRVIYLEASAHVTSPLSCHLEVVSWGKTPDQNPEYTALSYSWDAQAPSRQIQCNMTYPTRYAKLRGCASTPSAFGDTEDTMD